jgi:hypothetical protein
MAKKARGPKKGARTSVKATARKTAKARSGLKGAAKKPAAKKLAAKTNTLHGVFDVIAAFEKAVLASSHPRKADLLKLAGDSKKAWRDFCLALHAAGECEKPTPSFCSPIKP